MGLDHPALRDDDLTIIRQAIEGAEPGAWKADKLRGVSLDELLERGWMRLNVPTPYLPFADGGFLTPSGKCEFYSERMKEMGLDPLPSFTAAVRVPGGRSRPRERASRSR